MSIAGRLKELGLEQGHDYSLTTLTFPPRAHHKDFLGTNVLGTVPYFEHWEAGEQAPRAAMTESCAVPLYLTSLMDSPLGVTPSEPDAYGEVSGGLSG